MHMCFYLSHCGDSCKDKRMVPTRLTANFGVKTFYLLRSLGYYKPPGTSESEHNVLTINKNK